MILTVPSSEVSRVPTPDGPSPRFTRRVRLRKHGDFEKVYSTGRRVISAHMTVLFLPRDGDPTPARIGFTIARGVGNAVERNRVRRRLREATRLNLALVGDAVDVVIQPKKSVRTVEFASLCREVARAFERIRSAAGGAR
jgi:ribonuclease P protein component